ncbi:MAG: hypothetical protein JSS82_08900 [Bacteroidetes bacterium]|nr:hypothetical protein [Bacteroidota bacterium]
MKRLLVFLVLTFAACFAEARIDDIFFVKAKLLILTEQLDKYHIYIDKSVVQNFMNYPLIWNTIKNNRSSGIVTIVNIYAQPCPKQKFVTDDGESVYLSFYNNEQKGHIYKLAICGNSIYRLSGFANNEPGAVLKYLYERYRSGLLPGHGKMTFSSFCRNVDKIIKFDGIDFSKSLKERKKNLGRNGP